MFNDYTNLLVWKESHKLVLKIYNITEKFPQNEMYGLVSQIRRAAVSIPSNIVEGKSRGSQKDLLRFLMISRGSLEEVKYQILLSKDLEYISENEYNEIKEITENVGKLLNGFINSIKNNGSKSNTAG